MDEYYVISINDDIKYYLSIINEANTKIILAGGINNNCIKVIIDERENSGIIHDVFYNKKCRLNTYLKKRDSMELLLKSVLCFLHDKYPYIIEYNLTDNSYIKCGDKASVSLSDYYYVKYNKTWYEKKFDAVPQNIDKINNIKKNFYKNLRKKIKLSEDDFIKKYYTYMSIKNKKIMRGLYNKNIKLKDFITPLIDNNCYQYYTLFDLINSTFMFSDWKITKKTIKKYEIKNIIVKINKRVRHENVKNLVELLIYQH